MKILITLGEISDKYDWDKFCNMKGLNPWAMNEGQASRNEEVELTEDECKQLGIN